MLLYVSFSFWQVALVMQVPVLFNYSCLFISIMLGLTLKSSHTLGAENLSYVVDVCYMINLYILKFGKYFLSGYHVEDSLLGAGIIG